MKIKFRIGSTQDIRNLTYYKCIVKLHGIQNYKHDEEDLILNNGLIQKTAQNLKIIFKFNRTDFHSYHFDNDNYNLNRIVIAVILDKNYNANLREFKCDKYNINNPCQLPYSMINYQIPEIITPTEPRIPAVALCLQYIYELPAQFVDWLKLNLAFGIAEIIMYDSTKNRQVIKLVEKMFPGNNRIKVFH